MTREEDEHGNPLCCLSEPGGICDSHAHSLRWDITQEPLFPRLKQPGWRNDTNTGNANRAPEHETREAALQRMQESRRRKLRLLNAIFGRKVA